MSGQYKLIAKCDGSGNSPRGSSAACVVFDEDGQVLKEKAIFWGVSTNNIAEYKGVLLSIEVALALEADILQVFSDSQLIVNQLQEKWDCKGKDLQEIRRKVWEAADNLDLILIDWIPREQNSRADSLCTKILNEESPKSAYKKKSK